MTKEEAIKLVQQNAEALLTLKQPYRDDIDVIIEAINKDEDALKYTTKEIKQNRNIILDIVSKISYPHVLEFLPDKLRNDKDLVLNVVRKNASQLQFATDDLKSDKEIIKAVIIEDAYFALKFGDKKFREDRVVALEAVRYRHAHAYEFISEELKSDREIALTAIQNNVHILKHAPDQIKNDFELMKIAVETDGMAYKFFSNELQKNRELVLKAINNQNTYYEWVPELIEFVFKNGNEFRNDREIVLASVKRWGLHLELVSIELQADKEVVLEAYRKNQFSFKYAADTLKNDKDFILTIFNQKDGYHVLEYISEEFKNDADFKSAYKLAAKEGKIPYRYLPDDLKNSREAVLNSFQNKNESIDNVFDDVPEEFKDDKEIVLAALIPKGYLSLTWFKFESVSDRLKNDKEVVLAAVRNNGEAIKYASDSLKSDRDIVWEAICKSCLLEYVSEKFRDDKQIVITAIEKMGDYTHQIKYASDRLKNDREVALSAISKCGSDLEYVSSYLKNDREVVLAAVNKDGKALEFASDELKNDREVVKTAIKENIIALNFASMNLQEDHSILESLYGLVEVLLVQDSNSGKDVFELKGLNLQVLGEDYNEPLEYFEAKKVCESLGAGWRLPTNFEWKLIYIYMYKRGIGKIEGIYWGEYDSDLGAYKNSISENGYGCRNIVFNTEKSKFRAVRSM
jgi:hypothetical protein